MQSAYETENNTILPEKSNFTSVNSEVAQQQCRSYIVMLKKSIKELHGMLKIRLRVEFPDSVQVLNQLNEKLLSFSEIGTEVENLFQDLLEKSKIYNEGLVKAQKYDKLMIRLQEIEQAYKQQNEELIQKNRDFEEDNIEKQQKIQQISQELLQKMEEASNYKIKSETLENDLKLKNSEINRITIERDNIKRQSQNLNSLLKQVNEEKEVKTQKMQSMVEEKIEDLKEELMRVKEHYQKKIFDKDNMIEKLERELQFTKKELELNSEFTFLQSSMNNSPFQSYNTGNQLNNHRDQRPQQNNYPSNQVNSKNSQQQTTKNQKEPIQTSKHTKKATKEEQNSFRNDKFSVDDESYDKINEYSPNSSGGANIHLQKSDRNKMKNNLNSEYTELNERQNLSISKLDSPFTRYSTKEETQVRTSRDGKKINVSTIEHQNEEDDTLNQLSENSDEYSERKQTGRSQKKQQNHSFRKQDQEKSKDVSNTNQTNNLNEVSKNSKRQYDDLELEDMDDDLQYTKKKEDDEDDEEDMEEEEIEEDSKSYKNTTEQTKTFNNDISSNEDDDNSIGTNLNVNDDEFSDNDSIDQEVKRRLQIKQQEKQQQKKNKDINDFKETVSSINKLSNSQNQNKFNNLQTQKTSFSNNQYREIENRDQNINKPKSQSVSLKPNNKVNLVNKNDSYDRDQDVDSDESLERNAEQIRALQKKRNQQKFEENKKKLMQGKKSQQESISSEDD